MLSAYFSCNSVVASFYKLLRDVRFSTLCRLTYRCASHQRCNGIQYSVDGRKFGELQHRVSLVPSLNLVIFNLRLSPTFVRSSLFRAVALLLAINVFY